MAGLASIEAFKGNLTVTPEFSENCLTCGRSNFI